MGNRTTRGTGTTVDQACRDCLRQIFQTAAPTLEATPDELEARDGAIRVAGQPDRSMPFRDVLQRHGRTVVGEGAMVQDQTNPNVERGPAAHFAEVEVDKETGKVRILRYVPPTTSGSPSTGPLSRIKSRAAASRGSRWRWASNCTSTPRRVGA